MNKDLYLLNYESYYTRRCRRPEAEITGYLEYLAQSPENNPIRNVNFNPNDGVATQVTINWVGDEFNYVVVYNSATNRIDSRWYVLESVRLRNGQFRLNLYRDVIADNYSEVLNSTTFIEKATLPNDSPLIFNRENMSFNQIKKSETLLKDNTGVAWVVGYFDNNYPGSSDKTITANYAASIYAEFAAQEDFPYFNATFKRNFQNKVVTTMYQDDDVEGQRRAVVERQTNEGYTDFTKRNIRYLYAGAIPTNCLKIKKGLSDKTILEGCPNGMNEGLAAAIATQFSYNTVEAGWHNYDGKTIKIGSKFYSVSVDYQFDVEEEHNINDNTPSVFQILKNNFNTSLLDGIIQNYTTAFKVVSNVTIVTVNCTEVAAPQESLTITFPHVHKTLADAPYSMFAIPYPIEGEYKNIDRAKAIAIYTALANDMQPASGGGFLYDVQLLPYCPVPNLNGSNTVDAETVTSVTVAWREKTGNFYIPSRSSFTLQLFNYEIPVENKKLSNECDVYRLCSPNFANADEFSPAMNDGVDFFEVDCTYKPYNPYIHVHINYKGLYGSNYDDARGLICGGDFSLPIMSDAFQTYQIQNKNYAAIFDRQIENLQIQQKYQRINDIFSIASGTVGAAAGAASAGSKIGGGVGAAVGAGVGALTSIAGGIADYNINEALRNEAIDYSKDQFGYQLGNIQAKPQGLAKSSAFDVNNKFFPFVEYYSCTDEEKEAFINKITYNGMTVGVIGKIIDYQIAEPSYIKGKIIRFSSSLAADYHLTNALAAEIEKGVFI